MEENESKEEVVKKEEQQAEIETSENTEKIEKQDETNQQKEETKQNEKVEDTENGIEISNDVIAVIAGVAVSEVQGVASMAGGFAGGISEVFSGKDVKDLKIVNCHLGQGASVCAIKNGESVETSMGLTPLGGIPMGTRSGDLDPSVITYIMKKENLTPQEMEDILNKKSGVYGASKGVSVDFRDIENEALAGGTHAQLALDIYHYLTASYVAKCAVAMGGIDVLTFTAGVGEKGPISRKAICNQLEFFGVKIDDEKNKIRGEEVEISAEDSKVKIYVVPTNEELMIARETMKQVERNKGDVENLFQIVVKICQKIEVT